VPAGSRLVRVAPRPGRSRPGPCGLLPCPVAGPAVGGGLLAPGCPSRRLILPLAPALVRGCLAPAGLEVAALAAGVQDATRLAARRALPADRVPQRRAAPLPASGRAQVSTEAARLAARPATQGPLQLQPHGGWHPLLSSLTRSPPRHRRSERSARVGTDRAVPTLTAFPQVIACRATSARVATFQRRRAPFRSALRHPRCFTPSRPGGMRTSTLGTPRASHEARTLSPVASAYRAGNMA
jgi:hypothetical protein